MHNDDTWVRLLGNYTLILDKELIFLKKIADANQTIPKNTYTQAWWNIMNLYEHPDLGDRNTKREMLVTLLRLGPNIQTTTNMVFESLKKKESMEFGLYIFELYLSELLEIAGDFIKVFR